MKSLNTFIILLSGLLVAGCNTSVEVQVEADTQIPNEQEIFITRRRAVNRFEKIVNPVGTYYHPHRNDDVHSITNGGQCTLKNIAKGDIIDLYTTIPTPLNVRIADLSIRVHPNENDTFSAWVYHIWMDTNGLQFSVSNGSEEFGKLNKKPRPQPAL